MTQPLACGDHCLDLSSPVVMGILNVTPDSFFDGGRHNTLDAAVARALVMQDEGAALIDIGGASTRPGTDDTVSVQAECDRVLPVIEALRAHSDFHLPISVDTFHPPVMQAAAQAGASLLNDVRGLRAPGALEVARDTGLPICLMHMRGEPKTMSRLTQYEDVVASVMDFLQQRIAACEAVGIDRSRLIIDPGLGFAKTAEQNLLLLNQLSKLAELALPILIGVSRKVMFKALLDLEVGDRLPATLATTTMAVLNGANIVRCHDVKATREALDMVRFMQQAGEATHSV